MILKYIDYYNLYLSAKFIPRDTSFFSTILFKYLILETILTIMHPNILAKDIHFVSTKEWNNTPSQYKLNDIFSALTQLRFYLILWSLIALSGFYNARSERVR